MPNVISFQFVANGAAFLQTGQGSHACAFIPLKVPTMDVTIDIRM